MEMTLKLWREGKFVIASNERLGITTQGNTVKEAIQNFQDAFLLCIHDADWRKIHEISDVEYLNFLQKEKVAPPEQVAPPVVTATIDLSDIIQRLVQNVKKNSSTVGVASY